MGEGGVGFGLEIEMARNIFSTLFPARGRTTTAKLERRLGYTHQSALYINQFDDDDDKYDYYNIINFRAR